MTEAVNGKRKTILNTRVSRECIYYLCLFALAMIASVVLIFVAYKRQNEGLKIYAFILAPLFLSLTAVAARMLYASVGRIFVKGDSLYVKHALYTRRIEMKHLDSVKISTNKQTGETSIKLTYGEKSARLNLAGIEKSDLTELKKIKNNI